MSDKQKRDGRCPCCEFRQLGQDLAELVVRLDGLEGAAESLAAQGGFGGATAEGQEMEEVGRAIATKVQRNLSALREVASMMCYELWFALPVAEADEG